MKHSFLGVAMLITINLLVAIASFPASAQPPQTLNVEGYVFHNNSQGAENGVPVRITNLNLSQAFFTEVFAPPVPQLAGAYSASINGSIGHLAAVHAYNATHYGATILMLSTTTTQINVTMNISRPAELNVTINYPPNSSLFSPGVVFNVTANISSLVRTAEACTAFISFTDESVVNVTNGYSESLGTITSGSMVTAYFEVETLLAGSTNITVNASCSNTGIIFEGSHSDTVFNISVEDDDPPIITVIQPLNETEEKTSNDILFLYNVTDASPIDECRLYINNTLHGTAFNVEREETQNFTATLANSFYMWRIECDDAASNTGTTREYYLNVSVHQPNITSVLLPGTINLNPGSLKEVLCEVTVEDENGAGDIASVNATLYLSGENPANPENNASLYKNTSCEQVSSSGNTADYACSFNLYYYALNGTWICNATAMDNQGLEGNNFNTTIVDELYALNLSELVLNYGDIPTGETSTEETLTVYNIGNQPISIYVLGYGSDDPVSGDGLALMCSGPTDISVENHRFSLLQGEPFSSKTSLSSSFQFTGLSIPRQESPGSEMFNHTYWQLFVPPMEPANCIGTIVFSVTG